MLRIWWRNCALCVIGNSFHAANHTIPPPPSYEGYPFCPKDKNRSPFHGEKPLMITLFLGRVLCQSLKNDNAIA